MPFPASNGVLSDVLEQVSRFALAMKRQVEATRARMAAGSVGSSEIIDLDIRLRGWRAEIVKAASTPGIAAYAQAQLGNAQLDVVAEFNGMVAAIDSVTAWIRANFPRDANGFLLERTWGDSGPVDRQFTSAQTAQLRTQLDALIATVA